MSFKDMAEIISKCYVLYDQDEEIVTKTGSKYTRQNILPTAVLEL